MSAPSTRFLLEEAERRRRERERNGVITQAILGELFKQQVGFVLDESREKAALCTRRAGKTAMWSRYSVIKALAQPMSLIRLWAVSRLYAKQLLWRELLAVCARHKIPVKPHETELSIRFENGSEIRLLGADKDKEVQKKRGERTDMEVVLEAQGFSSYLRPLVEDVAQPCLVDRRGTFCLEGTPGPVQVGYWFAVSGNEPFASRWTSQGVTQGSDLIGAGWSMHRWSLLDNPFLPGIKDEVERIKTRRRWADDNPTYVREYLGRWVSDLGALFYSFDPIRNLYDPTAVRPFGHGWMHTLGWDLGALDDMALVVWGYHPDLPELYEAFSWKKPGASAQEVMDEITALEDQGFNFTKQVADTGGGGRMYVEEVERRFGRHFEAAKKSEKYEHVRMMNDDFRGGFLKLMPGSAYAEEVAQLARDQDWPPPEKPDAKPREDPKCDNHCSDSALYGWRAAQHYLHRLEPAKPQKGSAAWSKAEEDKMLERLLQRNQSAWWEKPT